MHMTLYSTCHISRFVLRSCRLHRQRTLIAMLRLVSLVLSIRMFEEHIMSNGAKSVLYAIAATLFYWSSLMVLDNPDILLGVAEGSLAVLALAAILVGLIG